MACPTIVAHITKRGAGSRCGCSLVFYTPEECVEQVFSEVRLIALGVKNIRTSEAPPVKSGDRQPEQQTLVVP